VISIEEM